MRSITNQMIEQNSIVEEDDDKVEGYFGSDD